MAVGEVGGVSATLLGEMVDGLMMLPHVLQYFDSGGFSWLHMQHLTRPRELPHALQYRAS